MSEPESPEDSQGPLGRGFMLWQIANGWQRAARSALQPTGLTYVQVLLLAGLAERINRNPRISQAALAQALGADAMMTSQVLRTLEAGGFLKREPDPDDTRARTLAITELGRQKLAEALPLLALADEQFFDPLGKKEERFVKSLRKLWRKRRLVGMPRGTTGTDEEPPAPVKKPDDEPKRRREKRGALERALEAG